MLVCASRSSALKKLYLLGIMKPTILLLLFATLLCSTPVEAQIADKDIYRCLPCGNNCDKAEYKSGGKCTDCEMQLVLASTINFSEVTTAGVCDYISRHPKTVLLDVRTKAEFEGSANPNFGTLKGAINIPIQELTQRISELKMYKEREILVFCSHSHRSPQAAYLLTQHGFNKVVNMAEGMSALHDVSCKK